MVCIESFIPFSFCIYYFSSAMKNGVLKHVKVVGSLGKLRSITFCKLQNYKNGIETRNFISKKLQIKRSILKKFSSMQMSFQITLLGAILKIFFIINQWKQPPDFLSIHGERSSPWTMTKFNPELKGKEIWGLEGEGVYGQGKLRDLIYVSQMLAQHPLSVRSM